MWGTSRRRPLRWTLPLPADEQREAWESEKSFYAKKKYEMLFSMHTHLDSSHLEDAVQYMSTHFVNSEQSYIFEYTEIVHEKENSQAP